MNQNLIDIYGNKIRVRVCGILEYNNQVLMVNHSGLNTENIFWNFPGGGVEEFESFEQALKREFKEETYLEIKIKKLCFINQIIKGSLHAFEFYFHVISDSVDFQLGYDPELNIITDIKWMTWQNIMSLNYNHAPHFLRKFDSIETLKMNNNYLNLLNGASIKNY